MVAVPLRTKDGYIREIAWVDVSDFARPEIGGKTWRLHPGGYASRGGYIDGKSCILLLHREILGLSPGDGLEVDHANRNRADNRRSNLRVVTHSANMQNTDVRKNNISNVKGVSWHKASERWRARITVDRTELFLGYYDTREEASIAYRKAAAEFHSLNPDADASGTVNRYTKYRPRVPRNNTSQFVGVTWHNRIGKWQARLGVNKKRFHLGYYASKQEAYDAYLQAAEKLHPLNPLVDSVAVEEVEVVA